MLKRVVSFNSICRGRWIEEQAGLIPAGSRVIDIGAGSAPYRAYFQHCEHRAHNFGKEPGTAGNYAALDYGSDILEIPAPDASFDVVLCTEVLEHVPDPIGAVREMSRLLRPGGLLLLSAPPGSQLHQVPYHFYGGVHPLLVPQAPDRCGLRSKERTTACRTLQPVQARNYALPCPHRSPVNPERWMAMAPARAPMAYHAPAYADSVPTGGTLTGSDRAGESRYCGQSRPCGQAGPAELGQ